MNRRIRIRIRIRTGAGRSGVTEEEIEIEPDGQEPHVKIRCLAQLRHERDGQRSKFSMVLFKSVPNPCELVNFLRFEAGLGSGRDE